MPPSSWYAIEVEEREFNGRTFRMITKAQPADRPATHESHSNLSP